MSAVKIHPKDCLYTLWFDLREQAKNIRPWDCDARTGWEQSCRDLLAAVPDVHQRYAWAHFLAEDFVHEVEGMPLDLVIGNLLRRTS